MRHCVHVLMGADLKQYAARLKKYVIKYGDGDDFLKTLTWEKQKDDGIDIKEAILDTNGNSSFVSTTLDMYATRLTDYDLLPLENQEMKMRHFFTSLHEKIVTINNRGDSNSLLLVLHLPLYDKELCQMALRIVETIRQGQSHYSVMVVALGSDLRKVISPDKYKSTTPLEEEQIYTQEAQNLQLLGEAHLNDSTLEQVVILQNVNIEGFALNLDSDSLVRILGEIALLTKEKYNVLFSQTASFDREHPITALGLSVLNLDKYYFANYLLRLSYLRIMEKEGIGAEEVDINKVAVIANQHLQSHQQLFSNFYQQEIVPLCKKGLSSEAITAQVAEKLREAMKKVSLSLTDYIASDELSLPEKKALLAMILGYDDPLLHGNLFNQDQLTLDSLDEDAVAGFIEANNSLVKKVINDDDTVTYEGGILTECVNEEGKVVLPLAEMQQLRNDMRESTNYIRQKTQELKDIEQMQMDSEESERLLTEEGFLFGGKLYRFDADHKEVEFEETYQPKKVTEKNVDLRNFFTKVKDQGEIGACTVFSIASIFEYILKKNANTNCDLSEMFVYYNVRHEEGKETEDTGSSYQDVIKSIGTKGICLEEKHPYSKSISDVPSDEAYQDALNRKIVKALNVEKSEDAIKSAIQEGYPVGISLKVFNSFNATTGFVDYPSEEELESGDFGYHAMVICGFIDETKHFVVRNSWGEKFGEQGYCYIPYSYICNDDLNRMACIVTEVDTVSSSTKTKVEGVVGERKIVQFNMSDAAIKSHIIKNLIREEELHLQRMQRKDVKLRQSYEKLLQTLGRQSVRNDILEKKKGELASQAAAAKERQRTINENDRPRILSNYDKQTWRVRIWLIACTAAAAIAWGIGWYSYTGDEDSETIEEAISWFESGLCLVLSGVICLLVIITVLYWWHIRSQRRKMEMELEESSAREASRARKLQAEHDEKKLRFFIAGMVIDELLSLKTSLDKKYQSMKAYLNNLNIWKMEEEKAIAEMEPLVKDPFIPLLHNQVLGDYFTANADEITSGMHLYEYFRDFQLGEASILAYKQHLKQSIHNNINDLLNNFSIFRHIMDRRSYPFLDKEYASAAKLLPVLDKKAEPFCRIHSSALTKPQARFLFLHTDAEDRAVWQNDFPQYFNTTPICEDIESPYKIVEVRLQPLAINEVQLMKQG